MEKWDTSSSYVYTTQEAYNDSADVEAGCPGFRHEWLLFVSLLIMIVILILGVTGNVLVFISMYTCRSLRTANNVLLLNLAVADLLACFFFTPMLFAVVTQSLASTAVMPRFFCVVQVWLRFVCCTVQQITLSAISVQRYAAIVHPLKRTGTRERVIATLIVSWTASGCLSAAAIYLGSSPIYGLCPCQHDNTIPTNLVDLYLLVPLGLTCLLIVVFFYAMIFRTVRKHVKEKDVSKYNSKAPGDVRNTLLTSCCCKICGLKKTNVVAPASSHSGNLILPSQTLMEGNSSLVTPELAIVKPDSIGMTTERTDESTPHQLANDTVKSSASHVDPNPSMQEGDDLPNSRQTQLPNAIDYVEIISFSRQDSDTFQAEGAENSYRNWQNYWDSDNSDVSCFKRRHHSLPDILADKYKNSSQNIAQREMLIDAETMSQSERDLRALGLHTCKKFRRKGLGPAGQSTIKSRNNMNVLNRPPFKRDVESSMVTFGEAESVNDDGRLPMERSDISRISRDEGSGLKGGEGSNDDALLHQNVCAVVPPEASSNIYGEVCIMNPKSRERGRRKIEAKTAKRALFIIAAFVICWLPITVITCLEDVVEPVVEIKIFCLTFSVLSAVINPLIYTFINTAYRNEFRRLLKKFCSR